MVGREPDANAERVDDEDGAGAEEGPGWARETVGWNRGAGARRRGEVGFWEERVVEDVGVGYGFRVSVRRVRRVRRVETEFWYERGAEITVD